MIDYSLDKSGIFRVTFTDTVTASDIDTYLIKFGTLTHLPSDFLAIYDLRNAHLKLRPSEIPEISKRADQVTDSYRIIRTAFITNQPALVALSVLFTRNNPTKKRIRKVFSTEEAAIKWLNQYK